MQETDLSIRSKLPNTGTSIFTIMTAMANQHNAINLSQGFPDFAPSQKLISLVDQCMRSGHNQYAPMAGVMALRERLAEKIEFMYSARLNPETEITITSGATQAIYTALTALVSEGDEVVVFQPAYDCYAPAIALAGAQPVYVDLPAPEFTINWDDLKKVIGPKTRMIIINTPHNPTGTILNAFDMMQLEKITRHTDILILSDEVYEHIVFDGVEHQSVLRYPNLAERCIAVFSFGKTFHATGWKLGYAVGPENLMAEFRKVHQFMVFSCNTPMQHALAEYLKEPGHYLQLKELYNEKRDFFLQALKGSAFRAVPSSGTYFQLLSFKKISEKDDVTFAKALTKELGVAAIPISVFYHRPVENFLLRFCFAKQNKTLEKAAELLQSIPLKT